MSEKTSKEISIDISKILSASKEEIKSLTLQSIRERLSSEIAYDVKGKISEEIEKFTKKELVPCIKKALQDNKIGIQTQIEENVAEACAEIGKSMVVSVKEKMSDSYNRREVLKAFFE